MKPTRLAAAFVLLAAVTAGCSESQDVETKDDVVTLSEEINSARNKAEASCESGTPSAEDDPCEQAVTIDTGRLTNRLFNFYVENIDQPTPEQMKDPAWVAENLDLDLTGASALIEYAVVDEDLGNARFCLLHASGAWALGETYGGVINSGPGGKPCQEPNYG